MYITYGRRFLMQFFKKNFKNFSYLLDITKNTPLQLIILRFCLINNQLITLYL
nr:MAG TPA: hypothetical protein [Caudoviricetes sp.]